MPIISDAPGLSNGDEGPMPELNGPGVLGPVPQAERILIDDTAAILLLRK